MVPMPRPIVIPCFQCLLQGLAWANVRRVCRMALPSLKATMFWQTCKSWILSNSSIFTFERPQGPRDWQYQNFIFTIHIHDCYMKHDIHFTFLGVKMTEKKCNCGLGWCRRWSRCSMNWWRWPTRWKPHTTPGLWMGFQSSRILSSFECNTVHVCKDRVCCYAGLSWTR